MRGRAVSDLVEPTSNCMKIWEKTEGRHLGALETLSSLYTGQNRLDFSVLHRGVYGKSAVRVILCGQRMIAPCASSGAIIAEEVDRQRAWIQV